MTRIANVALDGSKGYESRVLEWLRDRRPEIVTFQKIGTEESFPSGPLRDIGYGGKCLGKRSRSDLGVAVVVHRSLPRPEVVGGSLNPEQVESRFLTMRIGRLRVSSVYAPCNPNNLKHKRDVIAHRVAWLNGLKDHVANEGYHRQDTVLCGDFNVKFKADGPRTGPYGQDDEDALQAILDLGFVDLYRDRHPDPETKPGHTHGYREHQDPRNGTSRLHLMLASHSVARHRRDVWLDVDASPKPTKDGPPLVVDLDGLKV